MHAECEYYLHFFNVENGMDCEVNVKVTPTISCHGPSILNLYSDLKLFFSYKYVDLTTTTKFFFIFNEYKERQIIFAYNL